MIDNSENLAVYLDEINSENMRMRIGTEKLIRTSGNISFTRGKYHGGRYLYRNSDGDIIGALNYTGNRNKGYILSNIYVRPDYRRQGIATHLQTLAIKELRGSIISSNLTSYGKLLVANTLRES